MAVLFLGLKRGDGVLFWALYHGGSAGVYRDIAHTYSAAFLIQVTMRLRLHFDSNVARRPLTLLPPSLPLMDTASQYDEPTELGSATSLWRWLRDGLAGTPLAGLSSTSGRRWAGHYTVGGPSEMNDPPMFFKLYLAPPPSANAAANMVYFRGEGADSAGSFTLKGASDTETGVVIAVKNYGRWEWKWHGVITPFGMIGVWGTGTQASGWWWIWPQEWSERSPPP
jgi:hypothetical protein